jgi:hypothetical protein
MRSQKPYQVLPDEFVNRLQRQSHIDAFDLCRIAAWKSAQSVALITTNDRSAIEEVTAAAKAALHRWLEPAHNVIENTTEWTAYCDDVRTAVGSAKRKTGLLALEGVGYPMASAILRIWNPKSFPVIDRHAQQAVWHYHPEVLPPGTQINNGDRYTAYARTLAASTHFGDSRVVHERDKIAMEFGRAMGRT